MSKQNEVFVWGWGRIHRDHTSNMYLQLSPKLIEALPIQAVSTITTSHNYVLMSSYLGDVYSWNLSPSNSTSPSLFRGSATPETRYFKKIEFNERNPMRHAVCTPDHILTVTGNGVVYACSIGKEREAERQKEKAEREREHLEVVALLHKASSVSTALATSLSSPSPPPSSSSSSSAAPSAATNPDSSFLEGETHSRENFLNVLQALSLSLTSRPFVYPPLKSLRVVRVACGAGFSLISTDEGHVYSWGRGRHGRLGHGTCDDEALPRKVQALAGQRVTHIAAGFLHSVALTGNAHTIHIISETAVITKKHQ
eukprot:TRINITY_DN14146_c0_g1_i2.p1 TRINITY_DN14146_c0_g1~~TRINITY_DN14146_c0_g1_i2.p1  ORF type:complete len:312 (+),score=45.14 TRINITY_DN14146_c0_g1_i2:105-1040(+)